MRVIYIDNVAVNIAHIERYLYEPIMDAVVVVFASGHKAITSYTSMADFEAALKAAKEL